jgi:TRAP-type uncharacterized transport system fused permease subunit
LITRVTNVERGLMIVAGLILVYPSLLQDLIGVALFGFALLLQYRRGVTTGQKAS